MRKLYLLLFLLPLIVFAQKNIALQNTNVLLKDMNSKPDVSSFEKRSFSASSPDESVKHYYGQLPEMNNADCELKLIDHKESPVGIHLFYQQFYKGLPVYGSYLKVNLNRLGEQLSVFNHLYPSQNWNVAAHINDPSKGEAVFIVSGNELIPSYKKIINSIEVLADTKGNNLFSQDLRRYFSIGDTSINALVFNPDPLTTAGKLSGQDGTWKNFNDSDYALLNDQRAAVTFPGTFRNDSFYLENQYAVSSDVAPPNFAPTVLHTNNFFFLRSKPGFKETMAMFHIYTTQKYIQSIGFMGYPPFQLKVDAHSGYIDQSFFNLGDSTLNFGIGCVPDAEDADVIVHEYTHSISYSINTNGISSNERHALDEGISDIMATTYSRAVNSFHWRWVFNWDGHNECWPGRDAGSSLTYANITGEYHTDSQIWSSCIDDIVEEIGRDATIKLLFTSLFSYTPNTTMPEAAILFMQADSLLNSKYNSWKIGKFFNQRLLGNFPAGINDVTNSPSFKILNTAGFANGSGDAVIEVTMPSDISIYDLKGQKVYEMKLTSEKISISPAQFQSGFYFMTIENDKGKNTLKLTRF